MSEKKYSFRDEIKYGKQKEKEERALLNFKRNQFGLYFSAIVFFIVLLVTLAGMVLNRNLMMILLICSMTGVFHFVSGCGSHDLFFPPTGNLFHIRFV